MDLKLGEHIEEAIRRRGPDPRLVIRELLQWSNLPMGRQQAIEALLFPKTCARCGVNTDGKNGYGPYVLCRDCHSKPDLVEWVRSIVAVQK